MKLVKEVDESGGPGVGLFVRDVVVESLSDLPTKFIADDLPSGGLYLPYYDGTKWVEGDAVSATETRRTRALAIVADEASNKDEQTIEFIGAWKYTTDIDITTAPADTLIFAADVAAMERYRLCLAQVNASDKFPDSMHMGNADAALMVDNDSAPVLITAQGLRDLISSITQRQFDRMRAAVQIAQSVAAADDPATVDLDADKIIRTLEPVIAAEPVVLPETIASRRFGEKFPDNPEPGQQYYRTDLNLPFFYDPVREKWLGDLVPIQFGRSTSTPSGSGGYFRMINGMRLTFARGIGFDHSMVIVGATINNDIQATGDIIIASSGTTAAILTINGSRGTDDSLDAVVRQGSIIGVRNNTGRTLNNTQGLVFLRRLGV